MPYDFAVFILVSKSLDGIIPELPMMVGSQLNSLQFPALYPFLSQRRQTVLLLFHPQEKRGSVSYTAGCPQTVTGLLVYYSFHVFIGDVRRRCSGATKELVLQRDQSVLVGGMRRFVESITNAAGFTGKPAGAVAAPESYRDL